MRLEHVNLTVSDVDRSVRFYCTLLEMKVRWTGLTSAGRPAAHIGDDRTYLSLFQSAAASGVNRAPEDYESVGLNHFGYVVDDLDEAKDRLKALGITPKSVQNYDPGRRFYFYDPDGIEVELIEYETATVAD